MIDLHKLSFTKTIYMRKLTILFVAVFLVLNTLSVDAFLESLNELEKKNLETFMDDTVLPNGKYSDETCPVFSCSEDNEDFKDLVFCH